MNQRRLFPAVLLCALGAIATDFAHAETITAATYNIEVFHERFSATTKPTGDHELTHRLRADADKANWVTAQVILDPKFGPDVLVIEECCDQKELDQFNEQWLNKAYGTVIVFATNSERHQSLALMMKPGWKVLERRDQYYLEKDPGGGNERGDRLFARGPAFCLVQSPGGYQFWVGVTHQKSKSGNSVEVTKWRIREARRTHQIIKELEHSGKGNGDVMLLGDMNDELGYQEFELEAGGDALATLVGPKEDGVVLETKPLVDAGQISYGGYWRPQHRGFIDHVLCTKEMAGQVEEVKVFTTPLASVASDHYPVYVRFHADPVPATQAANR